MFGGSPASRADVLAAQRATGGEIGGETSARFSIDSAYNPRSNIPNVRGGWNEKKILRYLKANPSLHGVRTAELPRRNSANASHSGRLASSVLVVDDSQVNRTVLRAMLRKIGVANITMAEHGREAMKELKGGSNFDLVLTDLWMPGMDGYELVQTIRADASLARMPVYLVTADVEARAQAEAKGFTGILLKPVTLENLKSILGR